MNFAVLTLNRELQDQRDKLRTLENKSQTPAIENDLRITVKRIKELEEGLKILQPVGC